MRLPLAVNIESRDGTLTKDAKCVNALVEVKGEKKFLRSRPGNRDLGLVKAGVAQLLYYWSGKIRTVQADFFNTGSVSGSTFTLDTSVALSPTSASLSFSAQDNGSNAAQSYLMLKNATQAWTLTSAAGAVPTLITDVDYPGTYAVTVTSVTRSGTVATVTTASDTNFQVGSTVTMAGATPTDYSGAKVLTGVTPSSVTTIGPVVVTLTRSGTTATATSVLPHGFSNGQSITIAGAAEAGYNGTFTITWVSATSFTYTIVSDAVTTPATGTITLLHQPILYGNNSSANKDIWTFTYSQAGSYSYYQDGDTAYGIVGYNGTVSAATSVGFTLTTSGFPTVTGVNSGPISSKRVTPDGTITPSSITSSGGTATVTTSLAHRLNTGAKVYIGGASPSQYNGEYLITVTSTTTFTYALAGLATPATGTITATYNSTVGASFTFTIAGAPTTPATGTITATGGRSTVPGIAYLNGYFVVMDIYGVLYNSAEDNPSQWNALEYLIAQNETGAGVFLGKTQNYIVAFKENSTEFFYDAKKSPGSPLAPVDNGFTQIGCASGGSVADISGDYFWIAQSENIRGRSVYMMSGTQQAKISTPDIDRVLNASTLTTVHAFGLRFDGHSLYVLTLATSDVTLVYDVDSKIWAQYTSLTLQSGGSCAS